jgi:ubiquinone/menaquinone biosynthesis C-methylase UbiE
VPLAGAVERVLPLVRPELRDGVERSKGYLELPAPVLEQPGTVNTFMRSRTVSRIYERWWRPALGRAAKGALGPGMAEEHRIARLLLALKPGDGVLDVACGPGNFSRDFARVVGDSGLVVGIDASESMLDRAVRSGRGAGFDNLAFVRGDAVELPFRDGSFDAVCCFAALHLFPDPLRALDHMTRVLTRGGRIAIFTSVRGRSPLLRSFESLVGSSSGMRMFEQPEVVDALEERGFVEIRQRLSGFTQFVGGRLA